MTSCMTTSTTTGSYLEDEGKNYTYAKGKQGEDAGHRQWQGDE